jgi:hypothetical protein
MHIVDPMAGEFPIVTETEHVEIDVAAAGVCMAVVDQSLKEFDDLGDVSGGTRFG